ncbi:MAG: hypothetical protein TUN42_02025 [Dehalogenimonas sp.]
MNKKRVYERAPWKLELAAIIGLAILGLAGAGLGVWSSILGGGYQHPLYWALALFEGFTAWVTFKIPKEQSGFRFLIIVLALTLPLLVSNYSPLKYISSVIWVYIVSAYFLSILGNVTKALKRPKHKNNA